MGCSFAAIFDVGEEGRDHDHDHRGRRGGGRSERRMIDRAERDFFCEREREGAITEAKRAKKVREGAGSEILFVTLHVAMS